MKPETPRNAAPRKLMLRHKEGVSFVDMEDILLIQREERSTVLYLAGGERLVTSDSLSELDERLPDDLFFRTHKSYVVGLRHIDSITPYGRWTYVVKLRGTAHDALVTAERLEILQKMFA